MPELVLCLLKKILKTELNICELIISCYDVRKTGKVTQSWLLKVSKFTRTLDEEKTKHFFPKTYIQVAVCPPTNHGNAPNFKEHATLC